MTENTGGQEGTKVMAYTPEQQDDFKAMVSSMLILNPKLSIRKVQDQLTTQFKLELSKNYIGELLKEIHEERARRFVDITKDAAMAEMEDLVAILVQMLRQIIQAEEIVYKDPNRSVESRIISQKNRIAAIDTIFKMYERMMNMKMDLGIFERQLGRFKGDIRYIDMVKALQEYRDAKTKNQQPDQPAASGLTA